jgi:hypothetical protein
MPNSELWKLQYNKIGVGVTDFCSSPLITVHRHGLCSYVYRIRCLCLPGFPGKSVVKATIFQYTYFV